MTARPTGTDEEAARAQARRIAGRVLAHVPELVRGYLTGHVAGMSPFRELPDDVREVEVARTTRLFVEGFLGHVVDGTSPAPAGFAPFTERAAQRAEEGVPLDAVLGTHLVGMGHLVTVLREHAPRSPRTSPPTGTAAARRRHSACTRTRWTAASPAPPP